jgi:hypothetical protein
VTRIPIVRALALVVGLAAGIALGCGAGGSGGSCEETACQAQCAEHLDECGHPQEGTCHEGGCSCFSSGSDCTDYDEGSGTGPSDPATVGSSNSASSESGSGESGPSCDYDACAAMCAMQHDDCGDPYEASCYQGECECSPVPSDCGWTTGEDDRGGSESSGSSGGEGSGESSGSSGG